MSRVAQMVEEGQQQQLEEGGDAGGTDWPHVFSVAEQLLHLARQAQAAARPRAAEVSDAL